jgi:hypothetical protein
LNANRILMITGMLFFIFQSSFLRRYRYGLFTRPYWISGLVNVRF